MEALLGWTTLVSKTAGTFAARTSSDKEHLVVSLTDLVNLWHEDLNTEQILKRCKVVLINKWLHLWKTGFYFYNSQSQDLNPSLEMPTDKLISFLCELLHTTNSEDIKIDASNELRVELVIKKKRNEYPFNWHFHLEKQTPRQVFQMVNFLFTLFFNSCNSDLFILKILVSGNYHSSTFGCCKRSVSYLTYHSVCPKNRWTSKIVS